MFNPDYIGMVLGNRTIVDYDGPRMLGKGKVRDFYRFECSCGAAWVDFFSNIKARGKGACKACSTKGGSGARVDFVGRIVNDREILELVEWDTDSKHSQYKMRCSCGHDSVVRLDTAFQRGCMACHLEQMTDHAHFRVGQTVNGHKLLRYLGRKPCGETGKLRGRYRYLCRCGNIHEDTYSNIVHRTHFTTCRKPTL